ncbi:MAG TPA: hypothetical protein VMT89_16025, partial [Candidatus Acidoferrales bacterium]|nr:hypothetical protein [Candidatus Acidoferrales bacterium]
DTEGLALWESVESWRTNFSFADDASAGPDSFQKFSRGCAGGPNSGRYCESDADCYGVTPRSYDASHVGAFTAADPAASFHCVHTEGHFLHVNKESTFALCAYDDSQACANAIDAYAANEFSSDRLVLAPSGAVDAGDPGFFAANQFYLNDLSADGQSIVPYVVGAPDLGAYEAGQPSTHFGPR